MLEMVANEGTPNARDRIGKRDLAAGPRVPEGLVVRTVLARKPGEQRGWLARVADGPT